MLKFGVTRFTYDFLNGLVCNNELTYDVKKRNQTQADNGIELNERARRLLKSLIENYVREGMPVGSKALAKDSGLDLSPATIRNVMIDLEKLGLVSSPHTSAGRIPTNKGYRIFVDSLITVKAPSEGDLAQLRAELNVTESVDRLMSSVSSVLSGMTSMAGVVLVPRRDYSSLRRLEFLPLSEGRVLAILVVNDHEVQNRVIHTSKNYTEAELQQAANYLNTLFAGSDIRQVRRSVLQDMVSVKNSVNLAMQTAIDMADRVFDQNESDPADYVLTGQTNLMHFSDLADIDKLKQLFDAFNEKRDILHLLDECYSAQSMQIYIGEESGYQVLGDCSVVTAPYEVDGQILGVLGVIGPTRMNYERVIPLVDLTAKMLGTVLNQRD